jgi:hypothetical protein
MYPDAPEAYSFPNQYVFGSELLVAPIVTNLASVKVWLPSKSRYVDLFMGTVYDENREITLYRRLEEYPVLLSEGTILTLDADTAPGNGCLNPEALEIIVVVGRNAQAVILEGEEDDDDTQGDGGDGAETAPQNRQQYQKTTVTFHQSEGRLRSRRNKSTGHTPLSLDDLDPTRPESRRGLHGHNKSYQGQPLSNIRRPPSLAVACPSMSVSSGSHHSLTIDLGPSPQLSVIDPLPRREFQIMDYQTEFEMKDRIWDLVAHREGSWNSTVACSGNNPCTAVATGIRSFRNVLKVSRMVSLVK